MLNKLILVVGLLLCGATTHAQDFVTHVTLTTYNPCKAQCDDTPTITANNTKINLQKLNQGKLRYCAVSPDLLWCLSFGSIIEIDGYGRYEVVDTMNKRFDHYIDILQDKSKPNFKKEKIRVKLIRKPIKVLNKC